MDGWPGVLSAISPSRAEILQIRSGRRPSDADLLSMPGLAKQAIGEPAIRFTRSCSSAPEGDRPGQDLETIATIAGHRLRALSARRGRGRPDVRPVFAALSVKDYADALHRSYLMGQCTATRAGICGYEDQKKADDEESTAKLWAAVGVAAKPSRATAVPRQCLR